MHVQGMGAGALMALVFLGCGTESQPLPPREIVSIAEPEGWAPVPPAQDVYVDRRPSPVRCEPELGYTVEDYIGQQVFKVDTGWCNFITVEQGALVDLRADEIIDLKVWHFELSAPEPAQALLALAIDGESVWEQSVAIPGDAGLIETVIELTRDYPEGAELQFHVDNHGENNWMLFRLEREPGSD